MDQVVTSFTRNRKRAKIDSAVQEGSENPGAALPTWADVLAGDIERVIAAPLRTHRGSIFGSCGVSGMSARVNADLAGCTGRDEARNCRPSGFRWT